MCRESYSWEHFERLRKFEYRCPFDTKEKLRCIDVHARTGTRCTQCTTCHFCRCVSAARFVGPLPFCCVYNAATAWHGKHASHTEGTVVSCTACWCCALRLSLLAEQLYAMVEMHSISETPDTSVGFRVQAEDSGQEHPLPMQKEGSVAGEKACAACAAAIAFGFAWAKTSMDSSK